MATASHLISLRHSKVIQRVVTPDAHLREEHPVRYLRPMGAGTPLQLVVEPGSLHLSWLFWLVVVDFLCFTSVASFAAFSPSPPTTTTTTTTNNNNNHGTSVSRVPGQRVPLSLPASHTPRIRDSPSFPSPFGRWSPVARCGEWKAPHVPAGRTRK